MDYHQITFPASVVGEGAGPHGYTPVYEGIRHHAIDRYQRSDLMLILPAAQPWTVILPLCALFLFLVVLAQVLTNYTSAYLSAPREVAAFIATLSSSVAEDADYDDEIVSRVPSLAAQWRLRCTLRQIKKVGNDLRDDLGNMTMAMRNDAEKGSTMNRRAGSTLITNDITADGNSLDGGCLKLGARLLWANKRAALDDRIRRLELLRVRFLVLYLGTITAGVGDPRKIPDDTYLPAAATAARNDIISIAKGVKAEKQRRLPSSLPLNPTLQQSSSPRRAVTLPTEAGSHSGPDGPQMAMFAGVVNELQNSKKLRDRRVSTDCSVGKVRF